MDDLAAYFDLLGEPVMLAGQCLSAIVSEAGAVELLARFAQALAQHADLLGVVLRLAEHGLALVGLVGLVGSPPPRSCAGAR